MTTKSRLGTVLATVKFLAAGGIGGIAIYNTVIMVISAPSNQSLESIAAAAGAILMAGAAKILHVV